MYNQEEKNGNDWAENSVQITQLYAEKILIVDVYPELHSIDQFNYFVKQVDLKTIVGRQKLSFCIYFVMS